MIQVKDNNRQKQPVKQSAQKKTTQPVSQAKQAHNKNINNSNKKPVSKPAQKMVDNTNKTVSQNHKKTADKRPSQPRHNNVKPSVNHQAANLNKKKNQQNIEQNIDHMAKKITTTDLGQEMRKINSIKELFGYLRNKYFKKAKKMYYLVPPCPNCGSYVTGRFFKIKSNEYNNQWIIKEGLKNGEIMAPAEKIDDENVFCMACGNTWYHNISSSWFTYEQVEMQKDMRGTRQMLREITLEEFEGQPQKHGIIGGIKKYIGHI